jgi:hypothetical protein
MGLSFPTDWLVKDATINTLRNSVTDLVNSNYSLQNQRNGGISTLTTNTPSTLVLGAATMGAALYASCFDKNTGKINEALYNSYRSVFIETMRNIKYTAAASVAIDTAGILNAFTINFDKGAAVAKNTSGVGTASYESNIKKNILTKANNGNFFVAYNDKYAPAVVNGGNGSKILPIGVNEAKAQQTNKPKVKAQAKV